jgi:nitroimidazol reductase NimA-like FMN-containing flavoprotein (pyridoxamine 5'-phosphate oxidase superfamily)
MLGELNENEIDDLLKDQSVGRVGCYADGAVYIVPINYVYEADYIYSHSARGMKIDMMEKNPEVCFQADDISDITNWKSVIAWGTFEKITEVTENEQVMQKLINRVMPLINTETGHPSHGIAESETDIGLTKHLILYKIKLKKKSGRFEKR